MKDISGATATCQYIYERAHRVNTQNCRYDQRTFAWRSKNAMSASRILSLNQDLMIGNINRTLEESQGKTQSRKEFIFGFKEIELNC